MDTRRKGKNPLKISEKLGAPGHVEEPGIRRPRKLTRLKLTSRQGDNFFRTETSWGVLRTSARARRRKTRLHVKRGKGVRKKVLGRTCLRNTDRSEKVVRGEKSGYVVATAKTAGGKQLVDSCFWSARG